MKMFSIMIAIVFVVIAFLTLGPLTPDDIAWYSLAGIFFMDGLRG